MRPHSLTVIVLLTVFHCPVAYVDDLAFTVVILWTGFREFPVKMKDVRASGFLMKVVDVLGDYADIKILLKFS